MERHQPAYYLDRSPEEAAEFLARTVVASRAVGGFVKHADWKETLNRIGADPSLHGALIGAGIGGLGGLGLGLAGRRRKSPWATALSGAALGGLAGGAGTYLYNHPDVVSGSRAGDVARSAAEEQRVKAYTGASYADRLASKLGLRDVPIGPGGAPAATTATASGPPRTLDEARARDNPVTLGLGAAGEGAAGAGRGAWQVFAGNHPWINTGVAGLTAAADVGLRESARRFADARRAAQAFGHGMANYTAPDVQIPNPPLLPGDPPTTRPSDVGAGLHTLHQNLLHAQRTAHPLVRSWREAQQGKVLLGLQGKGGPIGTVPQHRGRPLSLRDLKSSDIAGRIAEGAGSVPAPQRGAWAGARSTAATLGAQLLANRLAHMFQGD
jgi:hypothetical protein